MKKSVSVTEFSADLKNRVPDEELMKKYGLSKNDLKRILDEFLTALSKGSPHVSVESEE